MLDFHLHMAGRGCNHSKIIASPSFENSVVVRFLKFSQDIPKEVYFSSLDTWWVKRIISLLDESSSVKHAVGLCLDKVYDENGQELNGLVQLYIPNEWGIKAREASQNKILLGASIHPYRKDAIEALEKLYKNHVFLIKWLPSMMGIDPLHTHCRPFYEFLREHNIPLLVHVDKEYTFKTPIKNWARYNHVQRLLTALQMKVKVIAAHAGTPTQMDELISIAERFENLYVDTSGIFSPSRVRYVEDLAKKVNQTVLKERMLYGSDWPIPAFPILLLDKIGIKNYKQIGKIRNPFDKDTVLKEMMGLSLEQMKKNEETLLTMVGKKL